MRPILCYFLLLPLACLAQSDSDFDFYTHHLMLFKWEIPSARRKALSGNNSDTLRLPEERHIVKKGNVLKIFSVTSADVQEYRLQYFGTGTLQGELLLSYTTIPSKRDAMSHSVQVVPMLNILYLDSDEYYQ